MKDITDKAVFHIIVELIHVIGTLWLLFSAVFENHNYGFYMLLRLLVSTCFLTKISEIPFVWSKLLCLAVIILYNPVFPIHIGYRAVWVFFDILLIPLLIGAEIYALKHTDYDGW